MEFGNRRKRKSSNFNPNHKDVDKAITIFLNSGGRITKLEVLKTGYLDFMAMKNEITADDFLMGI